MSRYPGAEMWRLAVDQYRETILDVCSATGALQVRDTLLPRSPWVQGTAWLIAPDLAVTNRHVLLPPGGGTAIARRIPGTTRARMKGDYAVSLNFVFDDGARAGRECLYQVIEVPFVAEERDPVDAAVLKVSHAAGPSPAPLAVSEASAFDIERLYVVGQPGLMPLLPEPVRLVFGDPDERKRVSFGQIMEPSEEDPAEIVHDASTIGGYSGGCVMGFLNREVRALHYWGDTSAGNRAITAAALRRHVSLGAFFGK
jgi:Trypsin-like peptidase domain